MAVGVATTTSIMNERLLLGRRQIALDDLMWAFRCV